MELISRLLTWCIDAVFPQSDTRRLVSEASSVAIGRLLNVRINESGITTLLPYRHPLVRAAIIEAKFHNNPKATALLAGVLNDYLEALFEETEALSPASYEVLPVPLGEKRRRERGYNQVEEVLKAAALPYTNTLLKRSKDTPPQTSLTRKLRIANMEGAFFVNEPLDRGTVYILVDDVTTTGSTLLAAKTALEQAGARTVLAVALAY